MSGGIDSETVAEDLMFFNAAATDYAYGSDDDGDVVMIQHNDEEGNISGYQTVTITVSDFKAVTP